VRLSCHGAVQGVGFRPTVHRLASGLGLIGWVRNAPDGAEIEIEGAAATVERFVRDLQSSLPPLARLDGLELEDVAPRGGVAFEVVGSEDGARRTALVPPDAALCEECRREMDDPRDRRHRYPFTTCTNCGPRFSLVRTLPYDRERTSMACFPLCPACRGEYEDPSDRRFHAEPVCCPACGPRVWLARPGTGDRGQGTGEEDPAAVARGAEAVSQAKEALGGGSIVAVKGLGGFQLACRADDERAVSSLRERKRRPAKRFAVMVRDLASARRLVDLDGAAEAALTGVRAPVVLAPRREGAAVTDAVAPGIVDLGVMLPTTPLHVELFRDAPYEALVMTSGNASDEPICRGNREALERLGTIADAFLLHDRDVVRRVDDSVVRSSGEGVFVVRRARGFVPEPLPLPVVSSEPVLAMGPFLQATSCLAVGKEAFLSQHVGDLDSEPARLFLVEVVDGLEEFLQVRGRIVVVDAHPDYPSTWLGARLARERGGRLLTVQHHLAHAAAVLAEHGRFPAVGAWCSALALDGTGWGEDAQAWGGEWLLLDGSLRWRRLAYLEPLALVGGEAAVREPWRVAAAALASAGEVELLERTPLAGLVAPDRLRTVARLATDPTWPRATGAGRVFEAAAAVLGLAAVNTYEGEAAARVEALAASWTGSVEPWPEVLGVLAARTPDPGPRVPVLPTGTLLVALARRAAAGEPPALVAAGFHATFCRLAAELTAVVVPDGVRTVAIGGGCLVNRLLRRGLASALVERGFEALLPQRVPPGDGGIAYGQAVVGAVSAARGGEPVREGGS